MGWSQIVSSVFVLLGILVAFGAWRGWFSLPIQTPGDEARAEMSVNRHDKLQARIVDLENQLHDIQSRHLKLESQYAVLWTKHARAMAAARYWRLKYEACAARVRELEAMLGAALAELEATRRALNDLESKCLDLDLVANRCLPRTQLLR